MKFEVVLQEKAITLKRLKEIALQLTKELPPKERRVFLLVGPMGSGKTQLLRYLFEALQVKEVASPTFAVHHQYESSWGLLDHVDLYRLETEEELESTGFWDLFRQTQGFLFVEWADRLDLSAYPLNWKPILIELTEDHSISIKKVVS